MTTEVRFRLTRLVESHGLLERDYADAVERISALEGQVKARDATVGAIEGECQAERDARRAAERRAADALAALEANESAAALGREIDALTAANKTLSDELASARAASSSSDGDCARIVAEGARLANADRGDAEARWRSANLASEGEGAAAVEAERTARLAAEAALRQTAAGFNAMEQNLAMARADADAERERAKAAERRGGDEARLRSAAEARLEALESSLAEEARKQGTLAERLRRTVADADAKLAGAVDRARVDAEELTRRNGVERARGDGLEEQILALSAKIDELNKLPRGPHFKAFVKLKEKNEDLVGRLQEHGVSAAPAAPPRAPDPKLLKRRASTNGKAAFGGGRASMTRRASADHMQAMLDAM